MFSSMYAAYDRIAGGAQARLEGKMVMQGHQYGDGRRIDLSLDLEHIHHCRSRLF